MDKVTLDRIQLLHPALREEAGLVYKEICDALTGSAFCRFAYTLRTFDEQDKLFAQGRTAPGAIVTKARGGQSFHNYGLAVDIVLIKHTDGKADTASWETTKDFDGDGKADWEEVVTIFKRYGWEWGGDWHFKDTPHFQKTFGRSVTQLLFQIENKHVIPNTNYPLLTS